MALPVPNIDQVKSTIRSTGLFLVGLFGGWFASKGWFTIDQLTSVFNNQVFLAAAGGIVLWVWGLVAHTDAAKINAAATVAEVQKDALTPEGLKLANASPVTEVKTA
jgi:hypothetical protein